MINSITTAMLLLPKPTSVEGLGGPFHRRLCLFFFPHVVSKTDAARIAKFGPEMFDDESRKPIYFEVKRSKVKVTRHKNSAVVGLTLL